jgi:D-3-phosphoglycerate dehydrogenase
MDRFCVALSGDFRRSDGSPTFPSFDLAPLADDPQIAVKWVDSVDGVIPAAELEDCDALILLIPRFTGSRQFPVRRSTPVSIDRRPTALRS